MATDSVVVLAIIDAVLVGMFFLFRVLPWSKPGPWRLIWVTATLAFVLFSLGETMAMVGGGSAIAFGVQAPLFGAILATTACLILVYVHGLRSDAEAVALAMRDELTGLPNFRAFVDQLAERLKAADLFGVAYFHFRGLGAVNDVYGTERGDALLKRVGALLRSHCTALDVAARLGADQFALLLSGTDSRIEEVSRKILDEFRAIAVNEVGGVGVQASIGIASRREASDPRRLIRLAYRAMREAQEASERDSSLAP